METIFSRTAMLFGDENMEKLKNSYVAVFGIGGVGSYVCEALARGGIYNIDLYDNDKVGITNINRQIIATNSTIGEYKTHIMKQRILDINPNARVNCHNVFYLPENSGDFDLGKYDYVVDAVDTVSAKIELVVRCNEKNIKIISSMGTGNKTDPTKFEVADIYKTSVCPLARVMRRELKKRGIKKLKTVYSKEEPMLIYSMKDEKSRIIPGSNSFTPAVAGLIIAGEVIKDLIN